MGNFIFSCLFVFLKMKKLELYNYNIKIISNLQKST